MLIPMKNNIYFSMANPDLYILVKPRVTLMTIAQDYSIITSLKATFIREQVCI